MLPEAVPGEGSVVNLGDPWLGGVRGVSGAAAGRGASIPVQETLLSCWDLGQDSPLGTGVSAVPGCPSLCASAAASSAPNLAQQCFGPS